ncbi:hypothetical protein GEMRC1_013517 [Eukaryota sp. GEM-RC1]
MPTINADMTIADVLRISSRTTTVFHEYGLDYCCGGDRVIRDAATEMSINIPNLLIDLGKAIQTPHSQLDRSDSTAIHPEVAQLSLPDIIDHIYMYHHAYIYAEAPRISHDFTKVVAAHGSKHPYLTKGRDIFNKLHEELMQHLHAEEQSIFPGIEFGDFTLEDIDKLRTEHNNAGELLVLLRSTMQDYKPPEDACYSFRTLLEKLLKLETNIFQHISEETAYVFSSAKV